MSDLLSYSKGYEPRAATTTLKFNGSKPEWESYQWQLKKVLDSVSDDLLSEHLTKEFAEIKNARQARLVARGTMWGSVRLPLTCTELEMTLPTERPTPSRERDSKFSTIFSFARSSSKCPNRLAWLVRMA